MHKRDLHGFKNYHLIIAIEDPYRKFLRGKLRTISFGGLVNTALLNRTHSYEFSLIFADYLYLREISSK